VRERTSELTALNAELNRAKIAAEEANLGKTRFLAAASHDLLQPLNAARLYVSSLIEQQDRHANDDSAQVDTGLAQKVDTSLSAVEEILDALLDISRLDAGKLAPERQDMHLNDLFDTLRVEFAPLAERKNLELRILPTRLVVNSDRRLLRRILQNLLSNAVRYTPRGKVLMGVRGRADHVRIEILDTGAGIPDDKQALVFGEFQRFSVVPGMEPGVGLGLSIVERIARVLDHPLSFTSISGRGTRFVLRLPRVTRPVPLSYAGVAPALPALAHATILCIDNDPSVLDGMRVLLEGWGCHIHLAKGLAEAQELEASVMARLDMMMVDYHLDGEADGLQSIEVLRRHCGVDVPAILITADRSTAVRSAALAQGFHILNKPIKPAVLRALLSRIVATQQAAE
jgi:CheY-like chemotaxis protein